MRGRSKTDWFGICLEAPDPQELADFYAAVLGWPVVKRDEHGAAIQVGKTNSYLSFQEGAGYVRLTWPAEPGQPLMMMQSTLPLTMSGKLSRPPLSSARPWPNTSPRKTARYYSIRRAIRSACTSIRRPWTK